MHVRGSTAGSSHGFTLVELMVVVLIIGVISAIALPVLVMAKDRSLQATCFTNQRAIEKAASIWVVGAPGRSMYDLGIWAGDITLDGVDRPAYYKLVRDGYLKAWPKCPSIPNPAMSAWPPRLEEYYIEYRSTEPTSANGLRWLGGLQRGCRIHGYYAKDGQMIGWPN